MTAAAAYVDAHNSSLTVTFRQLVRYVHYAFLGAESMPEFAQFLLNAEISIRKGTTTKRSLSDLAYSNQPWHDIFAGVDNLFAADARMCVDNAFQGISTPNDFLNCLSGQLDKNPVVAYEGISAATCLSWPNFVSYDVERCRGPKLKIKS